MAAPPILAKAMTPKQYTDIQKGLAAISEATQLKDKLVACGASCVDEQEQIDNTRMLLETMKAEFFPEKA